MLTRSAGAVAADAGVIPVGDPHRTVGADGDVDGAADLAGEGDIDAGWNGDGGGDAEGMAHPLRVAGHHHAGRPEGGVGGDVLGKDRIEPAE